MGTNGFFLIRLVMYCPAMEVMKDGPWGICMNRTGMRYDSEQAKKPREQVKNCQRKLLDDWKRFSATKQTHLGARFGGFIT